MSKKAAYIQKAKATIEEQTAKLNQLKAQVKSEVAEQKIEVYQQIELLEDKLTAAKLRLGEVVDSAEDSWEELTDRFEGVAEDLGTAFKKMFNKKS